MGRYPQMRPRALNAKPTVVRRSRLGADCVTSPMPSWSHHDREPAVVDSLPRREKCTLSDPGRFGRETRCPRSCGGRESYGPGRGRSGYFNRFGG